MWLRQRGGTDTEQGYGFPRPGGARMLPSALAREAGGPRAGRFSSACGAQRRVWGGDVQLVPREQVDHQVRRWGEGRATPSP